MRVAVVGCGAVGATAAHDLAVGGAAVDCYERDAVGAGSTGRAAGVVYDAFAAAVDARIAERALERFREFSGTGSFRFRETPYVWLATEEGAIADAIRDGVERMRQHGRPVELADAAALEARFPALRLDDVAVAAVTTGAGHTDPASYAESMAETARAAGVDCHEGAPVAVRVDPPRIVAGAGERVYDAILVAAGVHTRDLLRDAGIRIPLKPYRVQALVGPGPDAAFPMCYDATAGYYLRPHPEGLLAGDGTEPVEADPDDWERAGDDRFVEAMETRLDRRLRGWPGGGDRGGAARSGSDSNGVDRAWAGLCAATPDGDPLLGEVADGIFVAAGWQGHGFMRAPATAERVAEAILGGEGVPAFDPGRFDGDEAFEIVEGMAVE